GATREPPKRVVAVAHRAPVRQRRMSEPPARVPLIDGRPLRVGLRRGLPVLVEGVSGLAELRDTVGGVRGSGDLLGREQRGRGERPLPSGSCRRIARRSYSSSPG